MSRRASQAPEVLARADGDRRHPLRLGIHPHEAASFDLAALDELQQLLAHPRAVAVGETGLDYSRDYAPPAAQQKLFDAQLALASEWANPSSSTPARPTTTPALACSRTTALSILHCFSSPPLLVAALERGWCVSFAGNVTYKNAYDLRAAARRVPADRLLAETDSPYLAPQAMRGKPNEPAYVMHTLDALADARNVDQAELEAQIDRNAHEVLAL